METEATETAFTMPVLEKLFVRLYPDTKPHHQLITKFQKGLILFSNETELAGEGIGLGAPAIRYRGREYFSGSSTMEFEQTRKHATVIKKFSLNLAFERTFRNIKLETKTIGKIRRKLDILYMNHRHFRLLASSDMQGHLGIKTAIVQTKPVGTVNMTYNIDPPYIGIEAEFNLPQKKDLEKIYLLNEQSSTHFRKYYDSNGTILFDKDIGAWETVHATWACIHDVEDRFGFRLWKHKDAVLHRGREFLKGSLDWIGLDYEASPQNLRFNYDIELVRS